MNRPAPRVPVVVFAYNRPDLLARTLRSLRRQAVPSLYAFSDAPRTAADAHGVMASRRLLRSIDWCPMHLVERDQNLGLGASVVDGVTRVLCDHDAAVVMEDDLFLIDGAYQYVVAALDHYRGDQRVMSIGGWTHPRILPRDLNGRPYFDGKAGCWAWATWRRSWDGMGRPATEVMRQCADRGIDVARYGSDMPKLAAEAARKNLWAITWWYLHFLRGGLCLRPPHSLVEHLGWDGRGVTTTPDMIGWLNPPLRPCPLIPAEWPEPREHPDCPHLWRAAAGDEQDELAAL